MSEQLPLILCELTAITAALCMLFSRNMFNTVLLFLMAMLSVAGIFGLLGATYLFIVQLAVYGGGLAVLMLFAVMITGRKNARPAPLRTRITGIIPPLAILIFLVLQPIGNNRKPGPTTEDTLQAGIWLSGDFSLPFALSAILLIVALVGAIVIVIQKPEQDGH